MKETIAMIRETKSYFLEKIDKINKHQTRLTKTHGKRTQIIHIRKESWDITSDSVGIRMIIKE